MRYNVRVMERTVIEKDGKVLLPESVRERYHLLPDTPVRLIETRTGVLLIPLTDEPPSQALQDELEWWQAAGLQGWQLFSYEESQP